MDRLSALDAEFLHVEDGVGHMHIAGACVFDGPAPTPDEIEALIASKLHAIPRYRQRVRPVPLDLGRPVWVDDPHFHLGHHVHRTSLPTGATDLDFRLLMGRLMSQPLDRDRPLWDAWQVEGLPDDRWAMVFKVHHCMVDGIAGVGLLTVLLDLDPDATIATPEPWEPSPEPPGFAKVVDAWGGLLGDSLDRMRRLPHAVRHPSETARDTLDTVKGFGRIAAKLPFTPPLTIDGTIGPHRAWAHASADLDDVHTIRRRFGGTVNDVALAAVTAGYRELLRHHGDDIEHAVVRSLVPVSTRHVGEDGIPDNRVSLILCDLPVHLADPVDRLEAVQRRMGELKGSHMVEAGEAVTLAGDIAPPMVVRTVSRMLVRVLRRLPQRSVNTVTTNVPGPQFPLYCLGREMREYLPFVGITHGVRVGTAILSYNGRLFFGITGDEDSAPDVDVLARAAARDVATLAARAEAKAKPRTRATSKATAATPPPTT